MFNSKINNFFEKSQTFLSSLIIFECITIVKIMIRKKLNKNWLYDNWE